MTGDSDTDSLASIADVATTEVDATGSVTTVVDTRGFMAMDSAATGAEDPNDRFTPVL
jgi:hypothetical protein